MAHEAERVVAVARVPFRDEMVQCFASPEIAASVMHQSGRLTPFQQRVRDMQEESAIELSNKGKEKASPLAASRRNVAL